jgi:CRP-like cAMP-binding protein
MATLVTELWLRKLSRLNDLNDDERAALAGLPFSPRNVPVNFFVVREGQEVERCCLLVDGYVARHKMSREGRRQIVSFNMPGDMVDLQHSVLSRADHNVQTITAATVAWVPVEALTAVAAAFPRVATAFAKEALIDASIFREWVLNVGARSAKTRIAHLICEFVKRRETLELKPAEAVELPFTQEQLADATGLTAVHVNRMLRELAEDGAFTRNGRSIRIADWRRLVRIADFNAMYLHQAA